MQFLTRTLCAAILFHSAAAYASVYPIYEGSAFTLDRNDFEQEVPVWLASETATSVTFSLWGIEDNLNTATDSSYMPRSWDRKTTENGLEIAVKDGYRITSIQVTGKFKGELHPVPYTMPGDASNHVGFALHVAGMEMTSAHADDVDGTQAFTLSTGPIERDGEFGLALHGNSESTAESVWYYDDVWGDQYWLGAQSSAGISDLRLTINVSPVPEPGTWAMLAVGLLVAGGAGRLRRNGKGS
jgi:hypothetical protein